MKTLGSYGRPDEAYLIASVLEGSGLSPVVKDGHVVGVDWFYSQAVGGVKVEVPDDEFERALEVLNLPPAERPTLLCPACGSEKVRLRQLSEIAAIGMILGFLFPIASRRADCLQCKESFKVRQTVDGFRVAKSED